MPGRRHQHPAAKEIRHDHPDPHPVKWRGSWDIRPGRGSGPHPGRQEFARNFGVYLVLKGSRTIIASPDGTAAVNGSGNPGMASGGMGMC